MKIAITGHTAGLGQQIYNHFQDSHEVIGISRATGYDVSIDTDRIVEIGKTCDLFFNNVHSGTTQATLIAKLYQHTAIVTSGSIGSDYHLQNVPYFKEKKAVEVTHKKYKLQSPHAMLLLKMGWLTAEDYGCVPIGYRTVLNAIDFWIENPRISMIEFENIKHSSKNS